MAGDKLRVDSRRAAWRTVGDELVVLDLDGASYLSINATGAVMWGLLVAGANRDELIDALLAEFDVEPQVAQNDVDAYLADLNTRGLLLLDTPADHR